MYYGYNTKLVESEMTYKLGLILWRECFEQTYFYDSNCSATIDYDNLCLPVDI